MSEQLAPGQLGMQVTLEDGSKKIVPLKKSTICLNMIVKNESHIIERCFDSIKDYIDYWVITDTGSTDDTPKIIKKYFKKHKIPGELHHVPWKNFGYNRSKVMELSRNKADYCILMDADFKFICKDPQFKMKLYYDAYLVSYEGNLDYCQVLFVKSCYKWEYIGVTHEYIKCSDPSPKEKILTAKMPFFVFNHVGDGGCKSDKYERDVRLLTEGLKDEPDNVRYHFYLAQSYKDLRQWDKAVEWYQKRVDLGGWPEEVYYAMLQVGYCKFMGGAKFAEFGGYLLEAYHFRPIRLEALYLFVAFCRNEKKFLLGYSMGRPACDNPYPERDVLFIDRGIHEFRLMEETSICAFFLGKYIDCLYLNRQLLKIEHLPDDFKKKVEMRLQLCEQKLGQLKERNITNADIHATVVQHALNEKERIEKATKEGVLGTESSREEQNQGEMLERAKAGDFSTNDKIERLVDTNGDMMENEKSNLNISDKTFNEDNFNSNQNLNRENNSGDNSVVKEVDGFMFMKNVEIHAIDHAKVEFNFETLKKLTDEQNDIIGFNTNGVLKRADEKVGFMFNAELEGSFLKKNIYDGIKMALVQQGKSMPGFPAENLNRTINIDNGSEKETQTEKKNNNLVPDSNPNIERQFSQFNRQFKLSLDKYQLEIIEMNKKKLDNIIEGQLKILIIGNFLSFNMNNGIDSNRIKFFHHLVSQKNNIIIQGIEQNDFFTQGVDIKEIIYKLYGDDGPDLIVYYLMGTTELNMKFVFRGLESINIKKMVWIEDIQYHKLYYDLIKTLRFDSILLSYQNSKVKADYEKLFGTEVKVLDMEQSIDTKVFKPKDGIEKEFDILFYGYHDPRIYPFRHRLYNLLKANKDKFKVKFIEHPGYNNQNTVSNATGNVVTDNLAETINKSYMVICTKSKYDVLLKKYLEAGCCGSIVCGDLPPDYEGWKEKVFIININDTMSDEEILKELENNLGEKSVLLENGKKNLEFYQNNFSYEKGYNTFMEKVNNLGLELKSGIQEVIKKNNNLILDSKINREKNLFLELFKSKNEERQKEYYKVLEKNLENNQFSKIHVFLEEKDLKQELLRKYDKYGDKLVFIDMEVRLTFKKCLEFIRDNIKNNVVCVIANADIYFDESLSKTDEINMNNLVISLLRFDVTEKGYAELHNNNDGRSLTNDAQDCWILKTPIRVPEKSEFYFGVNGCDNKILYEFYQTGYNLVNCPYDIKSYHQHLINYRSYNEEEAMGGGFLMLDVTHLDQHRNDFEKHYKFMVGKKEQIEDIRKKNQESIIYYNTNLAKKKFKKAVPRKKDIEGKKDEDLLTEEQIKDIQSRMISEQKSILVVIDDKLNQDIIKKIYEDNFLDINIIKNNEFSGLKNLKNKDFIVNYSDSDILDLCFQNKAVYVGKVKDKNIKKKYFVIDMDDYKIDDNGLKIVNVIKNYNKEKILLKTKIEENYKLYFLNKIETNENIKLSVINNFPKYSVKNIFKDGLLDWRIENLKSDDIVLEWANNDNTDYLITSKIVKEYYYINHNKEICDLISSLTTAKVFCIPKNIDVQNEDFETFEDYISILNKLNDIKFTKIFITGKARIECAKICKKLLSNKSIDIIVETYQNRREQYREIEDSILNLKIIDNNGVGRGIFSL